MLDNSQVAHIAERQRLQVPQSAGLPGQDSTCKTPCAYSLLCISLELLPFSVVFLLLQPKRSCVCSTFTSWADSLGLVVAAPERSWLWRREGNAQARGELPNPRSLILFYVLIFVCSFCLQRFCQGLLESLSLVKVVIKKTPNPFRFFLRISMDHLCFPNQVMTAFMHKIRKYWKYWPSVKIRVFQIKTLFFKKFIHLPQFIHNESDCNYSKLVFRSFPEGFPDLTSRLYINCELQKTPQFGDDMCNCLTAFKSDAQMKLHQTETREGLF